VPAPNSRSWKTRTEAGSAFSIGVAAWVTRVLGRTAVAIFLVPVVAYFLLVRVEERRASRNFLSRVLRRNPHWWEIFGHFHTFARVASDRLFILTGRMDKLKVVIHGRPLLQSIAEKGSGCIILSSHLGSFEATRAASFDRPDIALHVLIDRSLNPNFQRRLESFDPVLASRVIDASRPPTALAMELAGVLGKAGWIGVPADRFRPGDKTLNCRFIGDQALFPAGPFNMACAFDVPIVFSVGLLLDGQYHLYFESLERSAARGREQRQQCAQLLAEAFADRLEIYTRIAPYNWFNFFDFWPGQ